MKFSNGVLVSLIFASWLVHTVFNNFDLLQRDSCLSSINHNWPKKDYKFRSVNSWMKVNRNHSQSTISLIYFIFENERQTLNHSQYRLVQSCLVGHILNFSHATCQTEWRTTCTLTLHNCFCLYIYIHTCICTFNIHNYKHISSYLYPLLLWYI